MGDQPFDSRDAAKAAFAGAVNGGKVTTYDQVGFDAIMGRRSGSFFYDAYDPDKRWINVHCNGGVFNLGHRNERVIAAVRGALDDLDIGNHHLISGHRANLAERLLASAGSHLGGVVFGVAGGEAVDLAIKVVRAHTGRSGVVSVIGGYHGHTGLAMAAGDAQYRDVFGANPPGFSQVPFDDLAALDAAVGDDTAAVIVETIPATLGMPIPSDGYLAGIQTLCRERGAKLIADEVQTGLGRTGKMWCYQHDDLEPDVVVTGKGLSGGIYPIAATLMTRELHALFDEHPFVHISTFGGSEVGCVAGLEVLNIVEEPGFLDRVSALAVRFAEGLAGKSFELRQKGMFMGLKFGNDHAGMFAAKLLYEAGVFAVYANNDRSVLQFLPPLVISDDEADELIETVRRTLP
jgi:acetylornithine/succinyldiaminopimelate/putrescine aminotransferase